ncbi:MAG TPA: IclR family transcriptional regulator [Microbacterium sp.]|nr:IclR family transcriptional regulator [Microbacterium sp.]
MRTADWTDSVSVLDRITAVFEAFGEEDEGLGVSELARRANLPKSTVSRIAADLVGQQLLDREGDRLYLGVRLFELGQTVEQPRRLRHHALPVMTDLRNLTGRTVHLAVLEGEDVVLVSQLRGDPALEPVGRVGGRLPAHATALGKALLAFSSDEALERVTSGSLTSRTARTIVEPAALQRELAETRRNGFATEREECVVGRACVASPILLHGAVPVAAISVTGSTADLDVERLAPAVRAAAMTLSRRVGAGRVS